VSWGGRSAQSAIAEGQRERKRQPLGASLGAGIWPGITGKRASLRFTVGIAASSSFV
jgi:hypothetical protein